MNIRPMETRAEIRRRPVVEKVVAPSVSHDIIAELRNELLGLNSNKDVRVWENLALEVQKPMSLSSLPKLVIQSS